MWLLSIKIRGTLMYSIDGKSIANLNLSNVGFFHRFTVNTFNVDIGICDRLIL